MENLNNSNESNKEFNQEKIIDKIRKVLELSKNNPSEEEAQAAALKAQKLMAEYHISIKEIETEVEGEELTENIVNVGNGNKWKYSLARVISNNFRCRYFTYNNDRIVFYGFKTDVEIASMTFEYLFKIGNKGANNQYQNLRNQADRNGRWFNGKGIKNCFLLGFVEGIKSVLEKQSTELMIITPKEVNDGYAERTEGFKAIKRKPLNTRSYYADESYNNGFMAGKNTMQSRSIEAN